MATKPTLKPVIVAPPPQKPLAYPNTTLPLRPPPSLYRPPKIHQKNQKAVPPPRYRHRRRRCCSGRRFCCLLSLSLLLISCLLLATASLGYLYYHPVVPSFRLQSVEASHFHVSNSSSGGPTTIDVTVAADVVSWNPNEKMGLVYSDGEGRVYVADVEGDIPLDEAIRVGGFEQAVKSAAVVKLEAGAKGVVVDDDVARRVRARVRRKGLECKVEVDVKVGVRIGRMVSAKFPVRISCGPASAASKCHVYLFRVGW